MIAENIIYDEAQQALDTIFKQYHAFLHKNTIVKFIINNFSQQYKKGIYVYGGVGRGKTLLTQKFYQELLLAKNMLHFQSFMQMIHEQLHQLRQDLGFKANLIDIIANNLSKQLKILILDEFELRDIADAMTIARLIPALQKRGIFIVMTTNIIPENLYKNGIQRDSFLPFIDYINRNFMIVKLDAKQDYRLTKNISFESRLLVPLSAATELKLKDYISFFTHNKLEASTLTVFGRQINFKNVTAVSLVTNFSELFAQDLAQADYIAICMHFSVIIIDEISAIEPQNKNLIIRFISFIDQAYYHKVIVIMRCEISPEIFLAACGLNEVARTISRLNEMNSIVFWQQAKFNTSVTA